MATSGNRDIIVVGASLGGIDALSARAAGLPADLPASVLVVQHRSGHAPGLLAVPAARPVPLAELPALLDRLSRQAAPDPLPVPETLRIEAELMERALTNDEWDAVPSRATDFTCPECSGALREIDEDGLVRYRCRVGHAFGADALVAAKDDAVEDGLWVALQTLQERAQMLETLARAERERARGRSAAGFEERAREARQQAERLHDFLVRLSA